MSMVVSSTEATQEGIRKGQTKCVLPRPIDLNNAVGLGPEASAICLIAAFGPGGRSQRSPGQRPGYAVASSCALKGHFRGVDVPLQGTLTFLHATQAAGLGYGDDAPLGLSEVSAAQKHVRSCRKVRSLGGKD